MYLYFCPNGQVIILFVLFISIHFVMTVRHQYSWMRLTDTKNECLLDKRDTPVHL
jgi:hypothetical protein